jgi:predicted nuclease with TOPRIM domain
MNRTRLSIVFALLGTLMIWGCAENSSDVPAAVTARLQEEVKELTTQRDKLRTELKNVRSERDTLQETISRLRREVKERDELLTQRTRERDQLAGNLDTLKKGLRSLMDQATSMTTNDAPETTAAAK